MDARGPLAVLRGEAFLHLYLQRPRHPGHLAPPSPAVWSNTVPLNDSACLIIRGLRRGFCQGSFLTSHPKFGELWACIRKTGRDSLSDIRGSSVQRCRLYPRLHMSFISLSYTSGVSAAPPLLYFSASSQSHVPFCIVFWPLAPLRPFHLAFSARLRININIRSGLHFLRNQPV